MKKVEILEIPFTKKEKGKKYKYKKILIIIFFILLIILNYFYINRMNEIKQQNKNLNKVHSISKIKESIGINTENINEPNDKNNDYWKFIKYKFINVDMNSLIKENNDTVGWLFVNNTNINYPIVHYTDNDYYLIHQFDKKYNSAGWIFTDYRNNTNILENRNTIIYGHGLKNKTMFGTLKNILKKEWYNNKENYVIKTSTKDYNMLWQVFSTYTINVTTDYLQTEFIDDFEYENFLELLKSRSFKNYNVLLNEKDKIITLSTCYTSNKRLVLHAKLIKIETK